METTQDAFPNADSVSYESPPVAEVQIEDVEYRVDAGLGSAVAISQREAGTSTWTPVAQGRWDGVRLRVKSLGHPVTSTLERALALAMAQRNEAFE